MAQMSSGAGCGSSATHANNLLNNRSSFRSANPINQVNRCFNPSLNDEVVEFIDEQQPHKEADNDMSTVYNFPWDFKAKSNPLLLQSVSMASGSFSNLPQTPPPPPQCPPPSTLTKSIEPPPSNSHDDDEMQYCAPWDLKLQEEMFKMMSQSKTVATTSQTVISSCSNPAQSVEEPTKSSSLEKSKKQDDLNDLNNSIKSNKSSNDMNSSSKPGKSVFFFIWLLKLFTKCKYSKRINESWSSAATTASKL